MTKRAIVYARVSTEDQADRGYSLPSQLAACRRYVEVQLFTLVGEFQDDISGITPIADRPEGRRVQALIDAGAVDAVIVYQVDRLFRDTVELLITARQWLRAGIELHFCDIGKVKSENDILLVIRGWAGSDEREKIAERMKRGKNGKAKSGLVVSPTTTPYGYDFNDGNLEINQDAVTVKLIFDWYTVGEESGKPLAILAIAKRLTAAGIKAPGANKHTVTHGTHWNAITVSRILSNTAYMGEWQWGNTRMVCGKREKNPTEPVITVKVPAIVSCEQFQLAQENKEYNKRMARRNRRQNYLLTGRVFCRCGRAMAGLFVHRRRIYRCTRASRHDLDINGQRLCNDTKSVREDVLVPLAWEYITDLVKDPVKRRQRLKAAQQAELNALQPKRERLEHIKGLLEACDKEALELKQALRKAQGRVGELLQIDMDEVNARYEKLTQEQGSLEEEIASGTLTDEEIEAIEIIFADDCYAGLEDPTTEEMQRTFRVLDLKITFIEDRRVEINCRLPLAGREFALRRT